ncbi:MAG: hypothetical protein ACI358_05830 [Candidatus Limimorpha sp.]
MRLKKLFKAYVISMVIGICFSPAHVFPQQNIDCQDNIEKGNDVVPDLYSYNKGSLSSGLAIFIATGIGYAITKKRKERG